MNLDVWKSGFPQLGANSRYFSSEVKLLNESSHLTR